MPLKLPPSAGLLIAVAAAACTSNSPFGPIDRSKYVDRVVEDVTAIVEGMANAHGIERVVLRGPERRTAPPPSEEN